MFSNMEMHVAHFTSENRFSMISTLEKIKYSNIITYLHCIPYTDFHYACTVRKGAIHKLRLEELDRTESVLTKNV